MFVVKLWTPDFVLCIPRGINKYIYIYNSPKLCFKRQCFGLKMRVMLITQRCLSCCSALLHRAKGFAGVEDHNAFEWGHFAGLGLSGAFFCVLTCALWIILYPCSSPELANRGSRIWAFPLQSVVLFWSRPLVSY